MINKNKIINITIETRVMLNSLERYQSRKKYFCIKTTLSCWLKRKIGYLLFGKINGLPFMDKHNQGSPFLTRRGGLFLTVKT